MNYRDKNDAYRGCADVEWDNLRTVEIPLAGASRHKPAYLCQGEAQRSLSGGGLDLERRVIAQCDVHEHAAAGGLKTEHQRLGVLGTLRTVLGGVQFGRMDAEMKSLIVQRYHCIANYLVG